MPFAMHLLRLVQFSLLCCTSSWHSLFGTDIASLVLLDSVMRSMDTTLCITLAFTVAVWFLTCAIPERSDFFGTSLLERYCVIISVFPFFRVGGLSKKTQSQNFEPWEVCYLLVEVSVIQFLWFWDTFSALCLSSVRFLGPLVLPGLETSYWTLLESLSSHLLVLQDAFDLVSS